MEIKLKSSFRFLMYFTVPFIFIFSGIIMVIVVIQIVDPVDVSEILPSIIISSVFILIEISILLFVKFFKTRIYVFSNDCIKVYKGELLLETINISDIELMIYYPLRLHYFITIFFGGLPEGGALKIHIKTKRGQKHWIGQLSEKEAIMIQKKLYPSLLVIKYYKKNIK